MIKIDKLQVKAIPLQWLSWKPDTYCSERYLLKNDFSLYYYITKPSFKLFGFQIFWLWACHVKVMFLFDRQSILNDHIFFCRQIYELMVFNATFNNISVTSWHSISLVKETGVPRENHWPVASHLQILSHNVVSSTPCHEQSSNSQL